MVAGCYHPPSQNHDDYFCNLSKVLDSLNSNYEKFLLIADFNSENHEIEISSFLNNHEVKNIVRKKRFFKSVLNPWCVDFFITNSPKTFQHTNSFPCGLSDHHNLVASFEKYLCQAKNLIYYKD